MPPQNSLPTSEQTCPWYQPLCRVTPVSKYLAMSIFIVLPFIGGYIGYLQGLAVKSVEVVNIVVPPVATAKADDTVTATTETFTPPPETFLYPAMEAKFTKATDVIRYALQTETNKNGDSKIPFDYYHEYQEIQGVTYGDQDAANVASLPYLVILATTSDFMVFSAPLFKETEGSDSGLYKLDTRTKNFTKMKNSDRFSPFATGAALSPSKQYVAVVSGYEGSKDEAPGLTYNGVSVGIIDLAADTYTNLKTYEILGNKRFSFCEMGCTTHMKWTASSSLEVGDFTFNKCADEYGTGEIQCTTTDKKGEYVAPVESVLKFTI